MNIVVRALPGVTTLTNIAAFTQVINRSLATDVDKDSQKVAPVLVICLQMPAPELRVKPDDQTAKPALKNMRPISSFSMSMNFTQSI